VALSRYGVSLLSIKLFGIKFPWGTLIVNLSGCFLIGLAFAWGERGFGIMNPSIRLFFMTGYLVALTTFSTFGLETVTSYQGRQLFVSIANITANNVVGIALVFSVWWRADCAQGTNLLQPYTIIEIFFSKKPIGKEPLYSAIIRMVRPESARCLVTKDRI
jgi:CrcB protein